MLRVVHDADVGEDAAREPAGLAGGEAAGGDLDEPLAFYDFPTEHHKHLRTTNATESTFATIRLRQRVTKGPCCRDAGAAMAYKLLEGAKARWRRVNAPELAALVRAGATFIDGKLQARHDNNDEQQGIPAEACAA